MEASFLCKISPNLLCLGNLKIMGYFNTFNVFGQARLCSHRGGCRFDILVDLGSDKQVDFSRQIRSTQVMVLTYLVLNLLR